MDNKNIISSMAMAFVESSSNLIEPPKVATIYRIASKTVLMPDLRKKWYAEVVLASIDTAVYTAACLIQNNEKEPTTKLIKRVERTYTSKQIAEVITLGLSGVTVDQVTALYELDKKAAGKKYTPKKADSVIHRQVGSFIKHFGFSEHEVKYMMTWENYLLYMNSIAGEDEAPKTDDQGQPIFEDGKHRYPVKDASEIF